MLQCVAGRCSVLQCVAVCCSVSAKRGVLKYLSPDCCIVLQSVAVCCSVCAKTGVLKDFSRVYRRDAFISVI